ncbi:hypothetical protein EG329_012650 [Mollisiaceae sp. DMI_Dod_QoI]|nr:hypothetical protein EG329_012650 [Helotiales sp. DMI_Dod_QoI]
MFEFRSGFSGYDVSWWLSTLVNALCMLVVQSVLWKTHRVRKVLPLEVVPTQLELYAAVACVWLAYLGSIKTIVHGARGFIWILSKFELVDIPSHGFLRGCDLVACLDNTLSDHFSGAGIVAQLVRQVITTWQLNQGLLFILDIAIPFIQSFHHKPRTTIETLYSRVNILVAFLKLITIGLASSHSPNHPKLRTANNDSHPLSTTQKVLLQRTQPSSPKKGRTLSWSLTVDKESIDEMKEMLGPPGGFGELGFCVTKNEVRFEAMGVGTSFALAFGAEGDEAVLMRKPPVRPEVKGKRRKTK